MMKIIPDMILRKLLNYNITYRLPTEQIRFPAKSEATGTPSIADNLSTDTDTSSLTVNNEP